MNLRILKPGERQRREEELREEFEFHLQEEIEDRVAAGASREAAELAARREFGNPTLAAEDVRESWGWGVFERLAYDVRYAWRALRGSPGFAVAVVLSLALGIGANTAALHLADGLLLRTLPVEDPQSLVQFVNTMPLWETGTGSFNGRFSWPQFENLRVQANSMSGLFAGTRVGRVNVVSEGNAGVARADAYTPNVFSVLGVKPQIGRLLDAQDESAFVAVLSDRYWRSRFGANPAIAGEGVRVNGIAFTIIGVAPAEFTDIAVGSGPDLWVPLRTLDRLQPDSSRWTDPFSASVFIVGRLRRGVSRGQAQSELDGVHRRFLAVRLPSSGLESRDDVRRFVADNHLSLQPAATGVYSSVRERYRLPLQVLIGITAAALLAACGNAALLLSARAAKRRREIAIRFALGATRTRLLRQLLLECVLLAFVSGLAATLMGVWCSQALIRALSPGDTAPILQIRFGWVVFVATFGLAMLAGVLFGMGPALRGTRVQPVAVMKDGERGYAGSSRGLDRALVMAQVVLSVALIATAGLFSNTMRELLRVNPGYEPEDVLLFSVDAGLAGYTPEQAGRVYNAILERLRQLPGALAASASVARPMDEQFSLGDRITEVDGQRLDPGPSIAWNAVSPGHFDALRTPLAEGRDFNHRDTESAPHVVIVNRTLATRLFPHDRAIGHRIAGAEIVGIAADALEDGPRSNVRPTLYYPLFQRGPEQAFRWGYVSFAVRSRGGVNLRDQVRREVAAVDRQLPVFRMETIARQMEKAMTAERVLTVLCGVLAGFALLLACVGLYGVAASSMARRTHEFGIRAALGAQNRGLIWLAMRQTLVLSFAGAVGGVGLAFVLAKFARALLFRTAPAEPWVIAAACAGVMLVAALAAYAPVRRALHDGPMHALRCE